MDYWAHHESPGYLLKELDRAAFYLNGNMPVKVVQRGFLDHTPAGILDPKNWQREKYENWFSRNLSGNQALWDPYIFKLHIPIPNGGTVEKTIYIHAIDQFDKTQIEYALDQIPGGLKGVIMQMIPSDPQILEKITVGLRKSPGSVMKLEEAADYANGKISLTSWTTAGRAGKLTLEELKEKLGAKKVGVFKCQFEDERTIVLTF